MTRGAKRTADTERTSRRMIVFGAVLCGWLVLGTVLAAATGENISVNPIMFVIALLGAVLLLAGLLVRYLPRR